MKAMEKIKLSKERVNLIADLKSGNLKGVAKIKASKRVVDIVVLLGGDGATGGVSGDTIFTEFGYFSPESKFFDVSGVSPRNAYDAAAGLLKRFLRNPAGQENSDLQVAQVVQIEPTVSKSDFFKLSMNECAAARERELQQYGDEKKALIAAFGKLKRVSTKNRQDEIQDLTKVIKRIYEGRADETRGAKYVIFWSDVNKEHPETVAKNDTANSKAKQYMEDLKAIKRGEGFVDFIDGPDVLPEDIESLKADGYIPFVFSPHFDLDKQSIKSTASRFSYIPNLTLWARKSAINPLYQSVLDGAAITVELIEKVIEEAKKDVSHPQLRPVVIRIRDHEQELVAA